MTFKVPYLNSRWFLLPVWLAVAAVALLVNLGWNSRQPGTEQWHNLDWVHHIPRLVFALAALIITFFAVARQWSLIPVLGLLTNLYLMSELGLTNWLRFLIWLVIGLVIYFTYGVKHSRLRQT